LPISWRPAAEKLSASWVSPLTPCVPGPRSGLRLQTPVIAPRSVLAMSGWCVGPLQLAVFYALFNRICRRW